MFTKTQKYKYCPNFGHAQNKSIIFTPGIHNLQTRTVTYPNQKKWLKKVDDG